MEYKELIADFGKRLGLDHFEPDEEGLCELDTDEFTVTLQHVPEHDMVLTTALVCELGPDPSAAFYRALLESNFMYQRTRGATLSVDAAANTVMLSRYDRLNQIDGEIFFRTIDGFFHALSEWKTWASVEVTGKKDVAPVASDKVFMSV